MVKNVLLTLCLLVSLAACGTTGTSGSSDLLPMALTMKATERVIEGDADKAGRVLEIATELKAYASGEASLTVNLLMTKLRAEIRWQDLDAVDTMLIETLLTDLRTRLEEKLGTEPLSEDLQLSVHKVADWVITAANLYAP